MQRKILDNFNYLGILLYIENEIDTLKADCVAYY